MPNIAYFDNAATTFPKPECVYMAMDSFSREIGVSIGRGQHKLSSKASHIADETRDLILSLFHCSNKKVVFTNTATEALNVILFGISLPSDCNIYMSPFEHNAVTRTLYHLAKLKKLSIVQLDVNSDYSFNMESICKQFHTKPPACVVISHVSNVIGSVAPVVEILSEAKKYNAITVADMCQSAGLIDIDISSDIFDYVVFAGHKTMYGPLGISGFITKTPESLPPLIYGGTGIESANQDMPMDSYARFEAGSHNTVSIAGLNASLKWIINTGINQIYTMEQKNSSRLIDILSQYSNIHMFLPKQHTGVVSCVFDNYTSDEIGQVLSENNVAVRSGLQCAPYAHKFINTFPAGTVRFSVSYFTSDRDFEQLDRTLRYIHDNS